MTTNSNEDNFRDYINKNPPYTTNEEPLDEAKEIAKAIIEGNQLLALDELKKKKESPPDDTEKLNRVLEKNSKDYYSIARVKILAKLSPEARQAIEQMINGQIPKDKRYDTFCQAVMIMGDKLSGLTNSEKSGEYN